MIWIVVCAAVAAVVILFAVTAGRIRTGWRMVGELSHPKRAAVSYDSFDCQIKKFTFLSAGSTRLSAIVYEPQCAPKGTILAFHYLGGSKTSIYPYVKNLIDHGYRVASFDYVNHGESQFRRSSRYTFDADLKSFMAQLRERGVEGPFGAIGFSMGASFALSAAVAYPQIRAVVSDSGPLLYSRSYFVHLLDHKGQSDHIVRAVFLTSYLFLMGFLKRDRQMARRLTLLRGKPILFIHGKRDSIIPIRNAYRALALCRSDRTQLIEIERGHHMTNRAILGNQYDRYVLDFFEKYMT